ncbi:MAG TPA: prolipoprotein diacylglyceryl transferase [Gemmatimonadales bacterium]|nr:prolipoprotein diacylglyceryl transferase [Gemmatimonadales bacterium]
MTIYPLVFHIGRFEITGYGLMMLVAFLAAGWITSLELRRRGLRDEYSADMVAAALVGGIIGAKVWYAILYHDASSLFSRGGLVWYGGFIGGALAVLINGWRLRVPTRWTMQLAAPALAASYALGRVGCFLVNDDYGRPTSLPWAMRFPDGRPPSTAANLHQLFGVPVPAGIAPDTVLAVHPTQLYEVALMLIAFAILWRLRTRAHATGWLFGLYLVFAGAERFLVEIVRAKDDRLLGPFTLAQLTSVVLIAIGAVLLTRWWSGPEVPPGSYLVGDKDGEANKTLAAAQPVAEVGVRTPESKM